VIGAIALVEARQKVREVAFHILLEPREGEGGLAGPALQERIWRAFQGIRIRVRDQRYRLTKLFPGLTAAK